MPSASATTCMMVESRCRRRPAMPKRQDTPDPRVRASARSVSHVNPLAAPGYLANDFTRTTPHEFLIRVAPLQRAEHTVRALVPEWRIRRLLKLEADEACLLIRRRTFSQGRVASLADLYHPGSRYELAANCQPR